MKQDQQVTTAIIHCGRISSPEIPAYLLTLVYGGIVLPNHSEKKPQPRPLATIKKQCNKRIFNSSLFKQKHSFNEKNNYILMDPTDENSKRLLPSYLCNTSYWIAKPDGYMLRTTPFIPAKENLLKIYIFVFFLYFFFVVKYQLLLYKFLYPYLHTFQIYFCEQNLLPYPSHKCM